MKPLLWELCSHRRPQAASAAFLRTLIHRVSTPTQISILKNKTVDSETSSFLRSSVFMAHNSCSFFCSSIGTRCPTHVAFIWLGDTVQSCKQLSVKSQQPLYCRVRGKPRRWCFHSERGPILRSLSKERNFCSESCQCQENNLLIALHQLGEALLFCFFGKERNRKLSWIGNKLDALLVKQNVEIHL